MSKISRAVSVVVAVSVTFAGLAQTAQAVPISTEQVAASQGVFSESAARVRLLSTLERADVAAALAERGLSLEQAKARVAALTDAEAAHVAEQIDQAPAGAGDFLTTVVFVFVLLLLTDILGFTKVFPFTRPIR
jgi:hypothetical protein